MFDSWITEARASLIKYGWRRKLIFGRARDIAAALRKEGIDQDVIPDYVRLTERGRLVWAVVIQVESAVFEGGPIEYPCNIVFSLEPYFDSRPQHLCKIAANISNLKHTFPSEPSLAKVAAVIKDEANYVFNWRLPYRVTDGHAVYFSSLMLHRTRLPRRRLIGPFIPVVVAPGEVECCMLAPLACWPKALASRKVEVERALEIEPALEIRTVSADQLAADEADASARPHKTIVAKDLISGSERALVTLTSECAREMHSIATQAHGNKVWHVRIGGTPSGRTMDVFVGAPPPTHAVVHSEGISIAVPKPDVHRLRGTVIDFRRTPMGGGFVFVDA